MRTIDFLLALMAAGLCSAASASAQDRFAGAERILGADLQRLLPGMIAVYEPKYEGIEQEYFGRGEGEHARRLRNRGTFYALRTYYDLHAGGGSYRVRDNQVCSIVVPETIERCRGVFRLPNGSYAFSSYEDSTRPAAKIRLVPTGSSTTAPPVNSSTMPTAPAASRRSSSRPWPRA